MFDEHCFAFSSVWMHSRSSTSESSNMQDYVAPVRSPSELLGVRAKFHDLDASVSATPASRDPALGDLG